MIKRQLLKESIQLLEKNGYEITAEATEKDREKLAKDVRKDLVPIMMEMIFKRSFGEEEFKYQIMEMYEPVSKIMNDKKLTKEEKAEMILDSCL